MQTKFEELTELTDEQGVPVSRRVHLLRPGDHVFAGATSLKVFDGLSDLRTHPLDVDYAEKQVWRWALNHSFWRMFLAFGWYISRVHKPLFVYDRMRLQMRRMYIDSIEGRDNPMLAVQMKEANDSICAIVALYTVYLKPLVDDLTKYPTAGYQCQAEESLIVEFGKKLQDWTHMLKPCVEGMIKTVPMTDTHHGLLNYVSNVAASTTQLEKDLRRILGCWIAPELLKLPDRA